MTDLSQLKCVACRGGEPSLTAAEIAQLQAVAEDSGASATAFEKPPHY